MSNEQRNLKNIDDVTPESLMERFKGPGMVKMIIVTLVFHAVLIFGTSVSYLKKSFLGGDVAAMTKEQRVEKAVEEATSSIRRIASENGLNPQDISDNFSSSASRAAKAAAGPAGKGVAPATNTPAEKVLVSKPESSEKIETPERPESKIEKELKKTVKGPSEPPAVGADDIF